MTTTTHYGWPKPAATDRVMDGWDAIADLADAADASLEEQRVTDSSTYALVDAGALKVNGVALTEAVFPATLARDTEVAAAIAAYQATLEAAWTAYTPTFTGGTLGNGTIAAAYKRIGKTLLVRIQLTWGSTSVGGTADWFIGIPRGMTANGAAAGSVLYRKSTGTAYSGTIFLAASSGSFHVYFGAGNFDAPAFLPSVPTTGDVFLFAPTVETA